MQDFEDILEMFEDYKRDPRPMAQEPRTNYANGLKVDPIADSDLKIGQALGAYRRYRKRSGRRLKKDPVINFDQFFELYAKENFAEGGSAGQLVQPNVDGSRPGYDGKQGGKKVPQQGFQKGNTYYLKNIGTFKTDEKKLNSLRKTLTNLDEGTTLNVNELHKSTGISRKTIDNIIAKEYGDKFDIPGMGKAQSLNMQKLNKDKQEKSLKEFNKIKKSYSKDLIEKYKFPSGSSKAKKYSNAELAKKYFGEANVATIGRVERLNNKLSKELKLSYPKGNESQTVATRKERLDKAKILAGEGVADINTAQKDVVKLLNDHYKKNPDELLGNTKLRNLLDLTLEDGEIVKKNKYVTDDDFRKLIQDKKGLFTMDHVDEVQFEKLSTEFPIFKQLATYNTNSGLIKSMKSYMSKNQNSKDPVIQNKIKKQVEFLEDLKLRVDTPTGRVGSKEVLAAVDRKAGVLPNFLAQLRALNIKLPKKAKVALGAIGGLSATTLATAEEVSQTPFPGMKPQGSPGQLNPETEEGLSTGQKVAGTGVAAGGAYTARKKIMSGLGKVARPFGTPLAGPLFAGYTAYDNLKQGKGIRESVIDPWVGMELAFPSLFTENISKITKNPTAQKIFNLGGAQKILGGAGVAITVGDILDNRAKAMKKESDRISTLEIDDQKKAIEDYAAKDYRGYAEGGLAGLMKKYYD